MIDFSIKTKEYIQSEQLRRVRNDIDKRDTSIIQTALGPESWEIEGIYLDLQEIQKNGIARYARGEFLDYKAEERAVFRNDAIAAIREGVFDKEVAIGARFSTIDGDNSVIFAVTESLGAAENGYYQYRLQCETSGIVGNAYYGSLLQVASSSFVQGLTYAQLTDIIIPGVDTESDESLYTRYLLSLQEQPFGGNIASYQQFISSQPECGAVQVYPTWDGGGTVKCSFLDANYNIATAELVEKIQDLVCPPAEAPSDAGFGIAPIGAVVTVTTGAMLEINVSAKVALAAGYALAAVQEAVSEAISAYLLGIRRNWGAMQISQNTATYPVSVFLSRISVAILGVDGVNNVTGLAVNGDTVDIECEESGETQQVPFLGAVILSV
ncbi:MAG: baseplate J/gp47 family protein [Oscillospiraceae bacterium]|nr:baseplate J/gp47 family protein [Oscillospiraceae bacterium]